MKRFWKNAVVERVAGSDGWTVLLDDRTVKTPAKRDVIVPAQAMAERIAAEWDAQDGEIVPMSMPLTRAAATCLDRVAPEQMIVADTIAAYGETDLLCYRAERPDGLVLKQAQGWDPLLDWLRHDLGAALNVASGVMHVPQDGDAIARLASEVHRQDAWALTCLSEMVTISGSLVLGLAVRRGAIDAESAWVLSRIDEQWNIDEWGEDEEAARQAEIRRGDFLRAADLLNLLGYLD
ncbi:MAG: ATP12 family chaperone protein [Paracoccaceae bacterium]